MFEKRGGAFIRAGVFNRYYKYNKNKTFNITI